MTRISWLAAASALVFVVGSGAAVSDDCPEWPNYNPEGKATANAMLSDISKIAKDKLKKDGDCATAADPQKCRREWTAVLGAKRRVEKKGKTWQIGCDEQWKHVEAALASANAGKAAECFGHLDYQKGN
jgi:hypothetical protein